MTTMTINIHNSNILESLKQVLSNMSGVEIMEIAEGKGTKINLEDLWIISNQ